MATLHLRSLLLLSVGLFSVTATAQSRGLSAGSNERAVREDNLRNDAYRIAAEARKALRRREFGRVERFVAQSRALAATLGEESPDATEVLAESYLVQGKPALALIGVGNLDRARQQILIQIGAAAAPNDFRDSQSVSDFPLDTSNGADALKASALLARAACQRFEPSPEAKDDLEEAVKLAPRCGSIHLLLAEQCA